MLHSELNSTFELCLLKFWSLCGGDELLNSTERNEVDLLLLPGDLMPMCGLYKSSTDGFIAVRMSMVFVMYFLSLYCLGGLQPNRCAFLSEMDGDFLVGCSLPVECERICECLGGLSLHAFALAILIVKFSTALFKSKFLSFRFFLF